MKKRTIGFTMAENTNKCNCGKNVEKEEHEEETDDTPKMSEEMMERIEEHVLAKHEYECSMEKLHNYQVWTKYIIYAAVAILLFAFGFYCGQRWTQHKWNIEKAMYKSYNIGKYQSMQTQYVRDLKMRNDHFEHQNRQHRAK